MTATATIEVSPPDAPRERRAAGVADRLADDWTRHHIKLVAVENHMASLAFAPIRRASRKITRAMVTLALPHDVASWDERAIVAVMTGIAADGDRLARAFLVNELAEFGRRWMATMAAVLFRHIPDRDIVRAAGHVRRRIARTAIARAHNPLAEAARDVTISLRVDASSVIADVLGQIDREAAEIARSPEGRRFLATFDAASEQRRNATKKAIRTAIAGGDSVDDLSDRLRSIVGGKSPEAVIDRIVRTRTQRVAWESEEVLLRYAGPAVKFVMYNAILDARTCLKCGPLHGQVFPLGPAGGPASGGSPAPTGPVGPTAPDARQKAVDASKRVTKPKTEAKT